jgi:hypothetical protein
MLGVMIGLDGSVDGIHFQKHESLIFHLISLKRNVTGDRAVRKAHGVCRTLGVFPNTSIQGGREGKTVDMYDALRMPSICTYYPD